MFGGLRLGHEKDKDQGAACMWVSYPLCSTWAALYSSRIPLCALPGLRATHMENVYIWLLQSRYDFRVPTIGWEALHPALLTGAGPMLHVIQSKDPEPVGARYGAQRVEGGDPIYTRPRVCPKLLRQGLFSPLQMITRELFHVPFFWHPFLGLG